MRSRGTRVWEVIELDADGREQRGAYVLKDAWVDVECAREGEIFRRIREDAKRRDASESADLANPDRVQWLKEIDRYFLTPLTYGDVYINDKPDKTRDWLIPEKVGLAQVIFEEPSVRRVMSNLSPVGGVSLDRTQLLVPKHLKTRAHHRTVFKGVGKTIREVHSLREAYKHLLQAVAGKRHIMCCLA